MIESGLAAGAIVVLVCSSTLGVKMQGILLNWLHRKRLPRLGRDYLESLLSCTFCASWWVSLLMLEHFSITHWAATVAVANITVTLILWGLSTE